MCCGRLAKHQLWTVEKCTGLTEGMGHFLLAWSQHLVTAGKPEESRPCSADGSADSQTCLQLKRMHGPGL